MPPIRLINKEAAALALSRLYIGATAKFLTGPDNEPREWLIVGLNEYIVTVKNLALQKYGGAIAKQTYEFSIEKSVIYQKEIETMPENLPLPPEAAKPRGRPRAAPKSALAVEPHMETTGPAAGNYAIPLPPDATTTDGLEWVEKAVQEAGAAFLQDITNIITTIYEREPEAETKPDFAPMCKHCINGNVKENKCDKFGPAIPWFVMFDARNCPDFLDGDEIPY